MVRVVSRKGGFSVDAPAQLTGKRIGHNVRLTTADKSMVITVGPGPRGSLAKAQKRAIADIRRSYGEVRVERRIDTTMAGGPAVRSVGVLRNDSGTQLVFSVTSTARGMRTWSVVMFADRDIEPEQLARFYDPCSRASRPSAEPAHWVGRGSSRSLCREAGPDLDEASRRSAGPPHRASLPGNSNQNRVILADSEPELEPAWNVKIDHA